MGDLDGAVLKIRGLALGKMSGRGVAGEMITAQVPSTQSLVLSTELSTDFGTKLGTSYLYRALGLRQHFYDDRQRCHISVNACLQMKQPLSWHRDWISGQKELAFRLAFTDQQSA